MRPQELRLCKRHAVTHGLVDSAPAAVRLMMLPRALPRASAQVLHAPAAEAALHASCDQVFPRAQQPVALSHPCIVQECDWYHPIPEDHEEFVDAEDCTDSDDDTGVFLPRLGLSESDSDGTETDTDTAAAGEGFDPSAKLPIASWPPSADYDDQDIALGWSMLQVHRQL